MKPTITIELNTKAYATLNVMAEERGEDFHLLAQKLLERAIMREKQGRSGKRSYTQELEDLIDDLCANVNQMKEILSREGY